MEQFAFVICQIIPEQAICGQILTTESNPQTAVFLLIAGHALVIVSDTGKRDACMISKGAIGLTTLAMLLAIASCSARSTACKCPKPVAYDDETLTKISQALRALPSDNVLQRAMEDYENERDDLRFCP